MKLALCALLCLSILCFVGCSDASDELQSSVTKLQGEKEQLQKEKKDLQDKILKYETGVALVKSKMGTLKMHAEFLDRNIDGLKSYIDGFGYYEWHSVAANVKRATSAVATDSKDIERSIRDLESQLNEVPKQ